MAISAGAVTGGAICIVAFYLVLWQLGKFIRTAEAAAHCHFPFLSRTVMNTRLEIIYNGLVAGCTFVFSRGRRVPDKITGMGDSFIIRSINAIMTTYATDFIVP